MPNCELCGKDATLFHADVEGTEVEVCKTCGSFGKILAFRNPAIQLRKQIQLPEELQMSEAVISDFATPVKNAREKRGLTQEAFARIINEKESIIHKIETGALKPSIPLARKLEKVLNIKLVENIEEEHLPKGKNSSGPVTIGDIIKRK